MICKLLIRSKLNFVIIIYDSTANTNNITVGINRTQELAIIAGSSRGTSVETLLVTMGIMRRKKRRFYYCD
jgi:hypothetical protein